MTGICSGTLIKYEESLENWPLVALSWSSKQDGAWLASQLVDSPLPCL